MVNSYLKSCFLIFPNYNLGHGLMEMAYNEYINEYYAKIGKVAPGFSPAITHTHTHTILCATVYSCNVAGF